MKKTCFLLFLSCFFWPYFLYAQPAGGKYRQNFDRKLASAGIGMRLPAKFWVIHPVQNPAMPYDFGLRSTREEFEVWFRVDRTEKVPGGDSIAVTAAQKQVPEISADPKYIAKTIPPEIMQEFFNADLGHSFAVTLKRGHRTRNYRYGLLLVVQKSQSASLTMLFLSNENGPAFYRNVNGIFYTVKFK